MHISLYVCLIDADLVVSRAGDVLTVNGEAFDFSGLPDGASIEDVPCEWIIGGVSRDGGSLVLKMLLPCGYDAPHERTFPAPIIDPPDGVITFPGDAA